MPDVKLQRQSSSALPTSPVKRSVAPEGGAAPPAKRRPTETVLTTEEWESIRVMVGVSTRHNLDPAARLLVLGQPSRESTNGQWCINRPNSIIEEQTMSNSARMQRDTFNINGHTICATYPESGIDNKVVLRWQKGELADDSAEINSQLQTQTFTTDEARPVTWLSKKVGATMPRPKSFQYANAHGMTVRASEYNGFVSADFQANRIEMNAPIPYRALARHPVVRTNSNGSGAVMLLAPNDPDATPNQLVKVPDAKQSYHAKDSALTDPDVCMWSLYLMQFEKDPVTKKITRTIFKLTAWADVVLHNFNISRGDLWMTFQSTLLNLKSFAAVFSNEEQFKECASDVTSIFSTLDGANPTSMAFKSQSRNLKMNGLLVDWDNVLKSFFRVPMDFTKSLMRFTPRPKSVTTHFSKAIDTDMVNNVLRKYQRSVGKNIVGNSRCEISQTCEHRLFAMHTDIEFQAQLLAFQNLDNLEIFMVPICNDFIVNDPVCAEIAMKLGGKRSSSAIVTIDAVTVFNQLALFPNQQDLAVIFEPMHECPAMIFLRERLSKHRSPVASPSAGAAAAH
jgi:hypothetical protein